jgi:hypothetical protein
MLSICRRILSQVNGHVKNLSFDDPYQFGLSMWRLLEMKSADNTIARLALIVLNEFHRSDP